MKSLTKLSLSLASHKPFQLSYIVKLFKKAKNLKVLYLNLDCIYESELKVLFGAIIRLKSLKKLYIHLDHCSLIPLAYLLKSTNSIEHLELIFEDAFFSDKDDIFTRISPFPLRRLTSLGLTLRNISAYIDNWVATLCWLIGKGIKNPNKCLKKFYLTLRQEYSPQLTYKGLLEAIKSFVKPNLITILGLKVVSEYENDDQLLSFSQLLFYTLEANQRLWLKSLDVCDSLSSRAIKEFIRSGHTLSLDNFGLHIDEDWTMDKLEESIIGFMKRIQVKKAITIKFPDRMNSDTDSDYGSCSENEGSFDGDVNPANLVRIMLKFIVSDMRRYTNGLSLVLDFSDSMFGSDEFILLDYAFVNRSYEPISYLDIKVPHVKDGLEEYDDEYDKSGKADDCVTVVEEMIKLACNMPRVKAFHIDFRDKDLNYFRLGRTFLGNLYINRSSILERLRITINITLKNTKYISQMFRIFSNLPKLREIEVICSLESFRVLRPIKAIIEQNSRVQIFFIIKDDD